MKNIATELYALIGPTYYNYIKQWLSVVFGFWFNQYVKIADIYSTYMERVFGVA